MASRHPAAGPAPWPHVSPLAPLREWTFVAYWLGGAVASCANWMLGLTVPYLVYELTGSSAWLGIAAVASNGPAIVASPLGGLWADRYSKRTVLLASLGVQITIGLSLHLLARQDGLTLPVLIGLAALMGFASASHLSAYQSFVGELVPLEQIAVAYRLNAIQFNVSRAVGPAVAGFVLAQGGPPLAFGLNAIAYLPLLAVLTVLPVGPRAGRVAGSAISALTEGAKVAWRDRRLRAALTTTTVTAVFGMSIHPLIAGLAKDVFQVDEKGLGLLVASIGAASVVTAIAAVWAGDAIARSRLVRVGLATYGAGMWIVAATDDFRVGLAGFAVTGFAHVLVNVSVTTSVQLHVPAELRGRVTSLQLMSIIVSMPVGAQIGGLLGDVLGLQAVLWIYGAALAGYAVVAHLRMGRLHALD